MRKWAYLSAALCLLLQPLLILAQSDSIFVLPLNYPPPQGANKVGVIKVGNNSTATSCDYEAVVNEAKKKAAALGGNIVTITELIPPYFIGKCYKIKAEVWYQKPLPPYHVARAPKDTAPPESYATLYLYRLKDSTLIPYPYSVYLNDSLVAVMRGKSKDSVRIYVNEHVLLRAKLEKKSELTLDVLKGKRYYVRCCLERGNLTMIPKLELIGEDVGKKEYQFKVKKDQSIEFLQQIH
jgi:hypothetical protein